MPAYSFISSVLSGNIFPVSPSIFPDYKKEVLFNSFAFDADRPVIFFRLFPAECISIKLHIRGEYSSPSTKFYYHNLQKPVIFSCTILLVMGLSARRHYPFIQKGLCSNFVPPCEKFLTVPALSEGLPLTSQGSTSGGEKLTGQSG